MLRTTPILLLALVMLALAAVALPSPPAAAQGTPPPITTPRPDERPDACEPNPDAGRACVLPVDAVSGPFTFVPEGDTDLYSLHLGDTPSGMETTITVRATTGLDLFATVSRADTGATLSTIASPAISTTLAADLSGWLLLRVENRAPGLAAGQSYRIEVRRTLPPPTGPEGLDRSPARPDALENNYDPQTAAPIGVGVVYDLSFVCPAAEGCAGGDHDYLRFDAKAGVGYLISTFDLAPGVDTVLDLFGSDPQRGWVPLAGNDDERPGAAFLSTLRWQAPADGAYLVRVGPRDGGLQPILSDDTPQPSYRFAVALAASDLAAQLEERIARQTGADRPVREPTAAPERTGGTGPAGPQAEPTPAPITDSAMVGQVIVTDAAAAYAAPSAASDLLATLPAGALATLTGRLSGAWAEITTSELVGSAWVDRRRLRLAAPAPTPSGTVPGPVPGTGDLQDAVGADRPISLRALPSPIQATPIIARDPVTVQAVVTVTLGSTPAPGLRVQLVDLFDTVLVELLTGADGAATLTTPAQPGHALYVRIPALGLHERLDAAEPTVTIALPGGTTR